MTIRTAIVTGASKGIGKAIVEQLIAEDYITILVDIDDEAGIHLASALGASAHYIHCDICNTKEVDALFSEVLERFGKVDVLVNNAGIIKDNVIWKMPEEDFDKVIDINLKGTWLMCKRASAIMREHKSVSFVA